MFYQIVALCFLCVLWRLWCKKQSSLEPPELSGRLPIVGHAHKLVGDGAHLYKVIQKMTEECLQKGGVMTINLGPRKTDDAAAAGPERGGEMTFQDGWFEVARERETWKDLGEAFAQQWDSTGVADPDDCLTLANTCLRKHPFFDFTKCVLGNGLITADVPTWKKNRKLLNPAFNQQVLDNFVGIFNTQAQDLVELFANELGKPFNHEHLLRKNNLETICQTALNVDASEYADLHENYLPRLQRVIKSVTERIQKFWLHSNFVFNMTEQKKILDEDVKYVLALSKSIIEKKKMERKNLSNTENKTGKIKTFIDLLLDLADDTGCFTDEQIQSETDSIIAGGHDTTAAVLTFVLTLLGSRTDIQEKAYEEIRHVLGNSEEIIEKSDLSKLTYIEAILKETMRYYTIFPVLSRCIDQDVKLKNYTIKANSECFLSVYGLHRHNIWGPDAYQFRPERWLEKDTLPDIKYLGAFGLGRRACIGKTYAMMSMKITLAHVLRKFRISSDISKMIIQMHVISEPVSGHNITLVLRNTSASI